VRLRRENVIGKFVTNAVQRYVSRIFHVYGAEVKSASNFGHLGPCALYILVGKFHQQRADINFERN
jgi:hypothetical protein